MGELHIQTIYDQTFQTLNTVHDASHCIVDPGREPAGPEMAIIAAIHRHKNGVITFHRKHSDSFENLFGIRSNDLQSMFPAFREQLEQDSHFSLNAFRSPENGRKHYLSAARVRQTKNLRYLCTSYVDLDCYKLGIDFETAFETVIAYQDERIIPPASIIVRSGRGMWLLWLLHDPKDPTQPVGFAAPICANGTSTGKPRVDYTLVVQKRLQTFEIRNGTSPDATIVWTSGPSTINRKEAI